MALNKLELQSMYRTYYLKQVGNNQARSKKKIKLFGFVKLLAPMYLCTRPLGWREIFNKLDSNLVKP